MLKLSFIITTEDIAFICHVTSLILLVHAVCCVTSLTSWLHSCPGGVHFAENTDAYAVENAL